MIIKSSQSEKDTVLNVAKLMATAARTAPKGHGIDNIETLIIEGDDRLPVMEELKKITKETGESFYARDGENIGNSTALLLIGVRNKPIMMTNCSLCGMKNCNEAIKAGVSCAFNVTDLGIAVGSAVSLAADHRIDNRVFFSAGKAAVRLGLLSDKVRVCYGIPLSAHGKSPYYDRG